eukprot:jgi/Botrbrau1/14860/Bobra.0326s0008.2
MFGCGGSGLGIPFHSSPARHPSWVAPRLRWSQASREPLNQANMVKFLKKQGFSTNTYTFSPGTYFAHHSHGVNKKDSIVSGRFLFGMHGEEVILEAGDMLEVPAGVTHYAKVVGDEPVTFIDASKY